MHRREVRVLRMSAAGRPRTAIGCTLNTAGGISQRARWREFNDDYLLELDRVPGCLTAHYARVDDSVPRLAELVRMEKVCCAFAAWTVSAGRSRLRLEVTGADRDLAMLTFLDEAPLVLRGVVQ